MLSGLKWVVAEDMIHLSTSVCPFTNQGKHPLHSHPHPWPDPYYMVRAEGFICYCAAVSECRAGCFVLTLCLLQALHVLSSLCWFLALLLAVLILSFLHANLLTKKMAPNYFSPVVSSLHAPLTRLTISCAVTWLISALCVTAHTDPSIPSSHLQSLGASC